MISTHVRRSPAITLMLALAFALTLGCNESEKAADGAGSTSNNTPRQPSKSVASGTPIQVTLNSTISSETANVGSEWHGSLTESVELQNGGRIAAGSAVHGVVSAVTPAQRGGRALLDLSVRSISVEGRDQRITANGEAVIAGSPRARNLGAIAGSAAAGALIGKNVGDGKNAAVGGAIAGAVATGIVARSKGYQVVLKPGMILDFTVSQPVAMR